MSELIIKGKRSKEVSFILGNLSTGEKNIGLNAMADFLVNNREEIIKANKIDLQAAMEKGTSKSMIDRLALSEERIEGMANGLRQVASLPDPVGEVLGMWTRPNGLQIGQKRVPLGVIGIIYEARPNVTSDAAGLCFKAGNAVILRGGSEAINSNKEIYLNAITITNISSLNLSSEFYLGSSFNDGLTSKLVSCTNTAIFPEPIPKGKIKYLDNATKPPTNGVSIFSRIVAPYSTLVIDGGQIILDSGESIVVYIGGFLPSSFDRIRIAFGWYEEEFYRESTNFQKC